MVNPRVTVSWFAGLNRAAQARSTSRGNFADPEDLWLPCTLCTPVERFSEIGSGDKYHAASILCREQAV